MYIYKLYTLHFKFTFTRFLKFLLRVIGFILRFLKFILFYFCTYCVCSQINAMWILQHLIYTGIRFRNDSVKSEILAIRSSLSLPQYVNSDRAFSKLNSLNGRLDMLMIDFDSIDRCPNLRFIGAISVSKRSRSAIIADWNGKQETILKRNMHVS